MLPVLLSCIALIAAISVSHYEVMRLLNCGLPRLAIPGRTKLPVVVFAAFAAHAVEMAVYGLALYALVRWASA